LITAELLKRFKKGDRFINIVRCALFDGAALVQIFKSGHLFAVGLDVHEHEPHVNQKLCKMRNVT
ncbi:hypothetical protein BU25DRAFT_350600, partial [Macroventuria anomochaeta]